MKTPIVPVVVYPSVANSLYLRGVGPVDDSGCPNYLYVLQKVETVGEETATAQLVSGNKSMTSDQWKNWATGGDTVDDEEYQMDCLALNLGLTRK